MSRSNGVLIMIVLSDKWTSKLCSQNETGMGYQIVSVILNDGKQFDQVVIIEGIITQIKKLNNTPFSEEQIKEIIVTQDKWDFNADQP